MNKQQMNDFIFWINEKKLGTCVGWYISAKWALKLTDNAFENAKALAKLNALKQAMLAQKRKVYSLRKAANAI